ncbi:MAG: nitroreductase [Ruminiclostridium sp.]|nr:nitroreductase [Ruminiclostridium sp.]
MELMEAMKNRHSVRSYSARKIEGDVKDKLQQLINDCNKESGLNIQLVLEEPSAFDSLIMHYGKFSGVRNYIVMVGRKTDDLDEKCGYYGQKIVLYAQQLGLNTCWVGVGYKKTRNAFIVGTDEKICVLIAIGYGNTQGKVHRSKAFEQVCSVSGTVPDWFRNGVEAALLAPTATNQQKFQFSLDGNKVYAKPGIGFFTKVDLGIAKYHFEIGANKENFTWA